jgi:hypothetical protein
MMMMSTMTISFLYHDLRTTPPNTRLQLTPAKYMRGQALAKAQSENAEMQF